MSLLSLFGAPGAGGGGGRSRVCRELDATLPSSGLEWLTGEGAARWSELMIFSCWVIFLRS